MPGFARTDWRRCNESDRSNAHNALLHGSGIDESSQSERAGQDLRHADSHADAYKNEIVTLSAPLDEAFERAAGLANGDVGRFMSQVRRDFEKLGEDSFCGIWCSAARDDLQSLSERALSAVEELGASLGRYDSTMQCTAIDRCINEISLEQQTLRLSLSSNKRMYIGIGGATGLIIAIVLI